MKITFDPAASADLDRIFAWISKDNQRAAYDMIARIGSRISLLAIPGLAYMGRARRDEGTHDSSKRHTLLCTKFTSSTARLSCFPSSTAHKIASAGKTSCKEHAKTGVHFF
jgi:plasmid stabilization system protein ParE